MKLAQAIVDFVFGLDDGDEVRQLGVQFLLPHLFSLQHRQRLLEDVQRPLLAQHVGFDRVGHLAFECQLQFLEGNPGLLDFLWVAPVAHLLRVQLLLLQLRFQVVERFHVIFIATIINRINIAKAGSEHRRGASGKRNSEQTGWNGGSSNAIAPVGHC